MNHLKRIATMVRKGALVTLDAMLGEPPQGLTQAHWRKYYPVIAQL